ncbi:MAG TPA: hypothetical protein ACFYD2_04740, partial [Candidatus Avalokitesvara rifleensis]|uniref:hypothetical protein n=1 Tax=Candidatus Avalokitesvara rifleensis TaxID=3367620 RepID=UPI002713E092|nr:hypothetical protein [Candidatus Brocadiales bacterium]
LNHSHYTKYGYPSGPADSPPSGKNQLESSITSGLIIGGHVSRKQEEAYQKFPSCQKEILSEHAGIILYEKSKLCKILLVNMIEDSQ